MIHAVLVVFLILSLYSPTFAQEQDSNNCHDPAA
jgi:hypothetical protein